MVMIRRRQLVETLIFFGLFTACMSARQNRILQGGRAGGRHLHSHPPHPRPNPNPLTSYARDAITLLTVKESLSSTSNPALSTWGFATPLCQWNGVTWSHESNARFDCTTELWSGSFTYATDLSAVATSLVLQSANLDGTLSPAIANLSQLTVLNLNNNSLGGLIPWELGNSPSLGVISLSHNHITGPMPASIWNLCRTSSKLITLILEFNNFTGHIPEPLGGQGMTCPNLTSLDVSNNFLSGSIPAFIANFASLSQLDLSNNLFTYVIPLEFARLTNLSTGPDGFSVANNHLTGPIPPFHRWFDESAFVGNSPLLCGLPLPPCVDDPGAHHHHARTRGLSPTGLYVLIVAVIICVVMVAAICIRRFSGAPAGLKERVYLLSGDGKLVEQVDGGSKGKLVRFQGCGEEVTEEAVLNASTEVRGKENSP